MVKAQPEGYYAVTPSLIVKDAAGLLDFMKDVFGAKERMRMDGPDGKIMHSEYMIGDSAVMVGDANDVFSPSGGSLHVYVQDCDAVYKKAMSAGATTIMPPEDQFYGDRSANVTDKWGVMWTISTHVKDVSDQEMESAMKEMATAGR